MTADDDPPGDLPGALLGGFGLRPPVTVDCLAAGGPTRSWRVADGRTRLVLRLVHGHDERRVRWRHTVLAALAGRGLPVVAPAPTVDGRTVVEFAGGIAEALAWLPGRHRPGSDLGPADCTALGTLLAQFHLALRDVPAPPEVLAPSGVPAPPTPTPAASSTEPHTSSTEPDAVPPRVRHWRSVLHQVAPVAAGVGERGWTHGDVHPLNVLWQGPAVVGLLDWDDLDVGGYADEVVRTAVAFFGPDLDRTAGFVGGYLARRPLPDAELHDALHRLWWRRFDDLRACLATPADAAPPSASPPPLHLADALETMLAWWTAHADQTRAAFTGPPAR